MEGNDRTEVLREKVFLSTNMNGWEVEEERQQSGAKLTRSAALRMVTRRNKVDIIVVQEHHFRSHEGLQEGTRRFRGLQWGYTGNTSLTPKSGTMVLWKEAQYKQVTAYSTCSRTLVVVLEDEEGQQWTIVSAHFHHDPGPRRKQWKRLVKALAGTRPRNIVMLADHNSILDETLDSKDPAKESTADATTAYRRTTQLAREVELDSYMEIGLMDSWQLIHEQSEDPMEMGLTYPAKEPKSPRGGSTGCRWERTCTMRCRGYTQ